MTGSSSSLSNNSGHNDKPPNIDTANTTQKRGMYFWITFLAICLALFMSALEATGTSTALPTIVGALHGDDFVWVGSAYPLAATALLPASGCIADVFGRRVTMLVALGFFSLGSALCGCAQSMSWLIAARTIQGAGGGAIQALASIIVSDLVPLRERAMYNSLIGLTWAVAASVGPVVGGGLAVSGNWRWFFYMNLPICGVVGFLVFFFLRLKIPPGSLREKLGRVDWIGNIIFVGSSTSAAIALTWGGLTHAWTSPATLVPLIVGFCGLAIFLFYEAKFASNPIVPLALLSNRTSLSGYLQTFFTPMINIGMTYYLMTWLQSVKGASPIRAGVYALPFTLALGLSLIFTGASVAITKSYRVQLWLGWAFFIASMGAFTTVHSDTSTATALGLWVLVGVGGGMLYSAQYFPVLAPLPISENAHALALFGFFRTFASVWAVTIGGTILQNQLVKRLPEAFTSQFSGGTALAYASIPIISGLPEPLRTEVRQAFAESTRVIWKVFTGIAGLGMVASFFMKALPLHTQVDERWGISEEEAAAGDNEKVVAVTVKEEPASMLPVLD
ncbi:iron permease [Irpex lacteus]|nr:iron permease [Irpex lacteus]